MNDETPIDPRQPDVEPVTTDAVGDESVARNYVHHELVDAQKSLRNTMIGSVLIAGLLSVYVIYLTARFRSSLEPREAATIAQGLISQKVDDQGPELKEYIKREVPNYIRQAPDMVIKELPTFRQRLQDQVNGEIDKYAKDSSERLGTQVDKFLDDNKDAVGTLLKDGQNPEATAKMTSGLKQSFLAFLDEAPVGGESLKAKLDTSLDLLTRVEARMRRLAEGKELTPQEVSARRSIAVLLRTINDKRGEEGKTEAIAPAAIDEARQRVQPAVEAAANNAADAAKSAVSATPTTNAPSAPAPKAAAPKATTPAPSAAKPSATPATGKPGAPPATPGNAPKPTGH